MGIFGRCAALALLAAALALPAAAQGTDDEFFDNCRSTAELSFGRYAREVAGYEFYFPNLLLDGGSVAVGSLSVPALPAYSTLTELSDGDRCCLAASSDETAICGVAFDSEFGLVYVEATLAEPSYVNTVISSWNEPCTEEPRPSYSLEYLDSDGTTWVKLLDRFLTNDGVNKIEPCSIVPGDTDSVSICIDVLDDFVLSQGIRMVYNTTEMIEDGADPFAGWMLELEVHGLLLTDPVSIVPTLDTSTVISEASAKQTVLPTYTVTTSNYDGDILDTDTTTAEISVAMAPGSGVVLSGTTTVPFQDSVAVFDDLVLASPTAGTYTMVFSSTSQLSSYSQEIEIVVGAPSALSIPTSTAFSSLVASASSQLPSFQIQTTDAGGSFVTDTRFVDISVVRVVEAEEEGGEPTREAVPIYDSGSLFQRGRITDGIYDSAAQDLTLEKPLSGSYLIVAAADGLDSAEFSFSVETGDVRSILARWVDGEPADLVADLETSIPEIEVVAVDGAGNVLGPQGTVYKIEVSLDTDRFALRGTTELFLQEGSAPFVDLSVLTPSAIEHQLSFVARGINNSVSVLTFDVVAGEPVRVSATAEGDVSALASLSSTRLPAITVRAVDHGGNPVLDHQDVVQVSLAPNNPSPIPSLRGNLTVLGTTADDELTFDFPSMFLVSPRSASYRLHFNSSIGLSGDSMSVTVVSGPPSDFCILLDDGTLPSPIVRESCLRDNDAQIPTDKQVSASFLVVPLDAGGGATLDTSDRDVTITIGDASAACEAVLLDDGSGLTAYRCTLVFQEPAHGALQAFFESPDISRSLRLSIVLGPPVALVVSPEVFEVPSEVQSFIGPFDVLAVDAAGEDQIEAFGEVTVQLIEVDPETLAPLPDASEIALDYSEQLEQGAISVDAATLFLERPATGTFRMQVLLNATIVGNVTVTVVPGSPNAIVATAPSASLLPSAERVEIEDIELTCVDAGGTPVPFTGSVTAIWTEQQGSIRTANMINGLATVSGLTLEVPLIGSYTVRFTACCIGTLGDENLEEDSLTFEIESGDPYSLFGSTNVVTVSAGTEVTLPALSTGLRDVSGNLVRADGAGLLTTVTLIDHPDAESRGAERPMQYAAVPFSDGSPAGELVEHERRKQATGASLAGTLSATVRSDGFASFDALSLDSPQVGDYQLVFAIDGLQGATIDVVVEHGPVASLETINRDGFRASNLEDGSMDETLLVALYDEVGNLVTSPHTLELAVPSCPLCVQGGDVVTSKTSGQADVTNFLFKGYRGRGYMVQINATNQEDSATFGPFYVPLNVTACGQNKQPVPADDYTDGTLCECEAGAGKGDGDECIECGTGFYKELPGDEQCTQCPLATMSTPLGAISVEECVCSQSFYRLGDDCLRCEEGMKCDGTSVVTPASGYWLTEDREVFRCSLPDLCNEGGCESGYTGVFCLLCEDGYEKVGYFCEECADDASNYVGVVMFVLFLGIVFILFLGAYASRLAASVTLKIMMNYLQMLAFTGLLLIPWPISFLKITEAASISLVNIQVKPLRCLWGLDFFDRLLLTILGPIFLLMIIMAFYTVQLYLRRGMAQTDEARNQAPAESKLEDRTRLRFWLVNAAMVVLFFSHPHVLERIFASWHCRYDVSEDGLLVDDMNQTCWTVRHTTWALVALGWFLIYCLLLPAAVLNRVYRYRVDGDETLAAFVFLFIGLKDKRWYWDWVIMFRKLVFVALPTFGAAWPSVQGYLGALVVTGGLVAQVHTKPYVNPLHNRLEEISLLSIYATLHAGIVFQLSDGGVSVLFNVIAILIHTIVVFYFVYHTVMSIRKREIMMTRTRTPTKKRTGDDGDFDDFEEDGADDDDNDQQDSDEDEVAVQKKEAQASASGAAGAEASTSGAVQEDSGAGIGVVNS